MLVESKLSAEQWLVTGFCTIVLIVLVYRSLFWQPSTAPIAPKEECVGTPIYTTYPFESGQLEPHACKQQCGTNQQNFVIYTDGRATQCERLPGCLDYGEDRGITCSIPEEYQLVSQ